MKITSICLSATPFIANTDATRLQMASKQVQQSLTSINCDIPYVISSNYIDLLNSYMGILIAEDDGFVVWNKNDLLVIFYRNKCELVAKYIPKIKKVFSTYGSFLRFSLPTGTEFKKGDIIFEYDVFKFGIPSIGYNVNTCFLTFAGFNHEDPVIISESFSEKATVTYVDKVFIPVYEQSLFKPIYPDGRFFPKIGEKIKGNIVAIGGFESDDPNHDANLLFLKSNINLAKLINNEIDLTKHESDIEDGVVIDIRIHKLTKNEPRFFQKALGTQLDEIYNYYVKRVATIYNELHKDFRNYTDVLLRKYFVCGRKKLKFKEFNLTNAAYLLEFHISKVSKSYKGDKFANRFAGKGVVSLIIPDELRPYGLLSKKPVDYIINTFSVPSRMNWGQLIETVLAKAVQNVDDNIKNGKSLPDELSRLLPLIEELHGVDDNYTRNFSELIKNLQSDQNLYQDILNKIQESNVFIEAKPFRQLDIRKIYNIANSFCPIEEPIVFSKKLFNFLKDKLGSSVIDLTMNSDEIHVNGTLGPQYILKLSKIADDISWSRDFGPIKITTGQPLRGRSKKGGVRLGNMEIDGLLAHGCTKALKEFLTVKSDSKYLKEELLVQLLKTGEFRLSLAENESITSTTREVINTIIEFLTY